MESLYIRCNQNFKENAFIFSKIMYKLVLHFSWQQTSRICGRLITWASSVMEPWRTESDIRVLSSLILASYQFIFGRNWHSIGCNCSVVALEQKATFLPHGWSSAYAHRWRQLLSRVFHRGHLLEISYVLSVFSLLWKFSLKKPSNSQSWILFKSCSHCKITWI